MTEQELEIVRLKLRLEVQQVLVRGLYIALANSSPSAAQAFRESFSKLRLEHSKIVLEGVKDGYSDLIAAEYQDALEDYLSNIERGLTP
ncbi:MAG: hypothetical protein CFE43_03915 [Burkholderiales bacterium PBB3]|nr:MAG: hypothetical protein CFE43_03915 [Burkholderiales bacterium PBB3]